MAPSVYIEGNPAPGAPIARSFERAAAGLTAVSPITGNVDRLTQYLADPVELKFLHMVTGDPERTPSFVLFGNADYYFQTYGTPDLVEAPAYAWNHGGTNPALAGDDATYATIEGQIAGWTTQRDALAAKIIEVLEDAEFNARPLDTDSALGLALQAGALVAQVEAATH